MTYSLTVEPWKFGQRCSLAVELWPRCLLTVELWSLDHFDPVMIHSVPFSYLDDD